MKGAKITGKLEYLEKFERAMRDAESMSVKVGIFGQKNGRSDGETNADIGYKQEFGFIISEGPFKGARVPSRSFLRYPLSVMREELASEATSLILLLRQLKVAEMFKRLGVLGVKTITRAFSTRGFGTWQENSPATILLKGSDTPLIDTGALRRSIAYEVMVKK
jgi:hypothetical protein